MKKIYRALLQILGLMLSLVIVTGGLFAGRDYVNAASRTVARAHSPHFTNDLLPQLMGTPTPTRIQQNDDLSPLRVSDNDLHFDHISVAQGLSENSVYGITQDAQGYMWFGTQEGLNQYNGYDFTIYKPSPSDNSLSHSFINSIHRGANNIMWIGTSGGGLNKFDQQSEQFTTYRHDPKTPGSLSNDIVWSVYEDHTGTLWVGTDHGLNRLDPGGESFTRYYHDPNDAHSLTHNIVYAIYEDRQGELWIGTHAGLNRFDRQNEQFTRYQNSLRDPYSLSFNIVWTIYQDREDNLWVGTEYGLNRYDREQDNFTRYYHTKTPTSLSNNAIQTIFQDQAGTLWVGTKTGLNRFINQTEEFIHYYYDPTLPNSLSTNWILSIYEDRENILWIGTFGGGINKFNRATERFEHYQNIPSDTAGYNNKYTWAIREDKDGILWIGSGDGELNRLDRQTEEITVYHPKPQDAQGLSGILIRSIYQDHEGILWIGTYGGGLNRFDPETEQFTHYYNIPYNSKSLSSNWVRNIYEDHNHQLWIGTYGGGLNRFDRSTKEFTRYLHDPDNPQSLSSDYIWCIYEDRNFNLWIGTRGAGINKLDLSTAEAPSPANAQFTHYYADPHSQNGLSHNEIFAIHEDQAGILWIGTYGGGLNRFDPETESFTHYSEQERLSNDVIYGILEDDQEQLWLSTNRGITIFDTRTETTKYYDVNDGLQSNEFNAGSYHKGHDGEMFFGGINGLTAFHPEDIQSNPYIPPVVLTHITQSGETLAIPRTPAEHPAITLHWPSNFFEFEFAALSYANTTKNQYAYKLENFDKDWNYTGTRRFGRYTNLPGGVYTLRIKGSNNDGLWNEKGISMDITIRPPIWQTRGFIGTLIVITLGGLIGGYRMRLQSIKSRNQTLEREISERTQALAQHAREIEERRQELEALYRADADLYKSLGLDAVLETLVNIVVDILGADKSAILVCDAVSQTLNVRVSRGFTPPTLDQMVYSAEQGTEGYLMSTGKSVTVEDTRTDSRLAKQHNGSGPEGTRAFIQAPILVGGEVFGIFNAYYIHPHCFSNDEQRLFLALAQRAALAIDNAQLHEQARTLAIVEERNRLARDLHDAVTQTLFSASLIAEVLPKLWKKDQDEGHKLLGELRQLNRGALAEMRTLLLELRPTALLETDLKALLQQLGEAITGREGIPVHVNAISTCDLPEDVHIALYRIAQEALNNITKHARASQVMLTLHCQLSAENVCSAKLQISDDGCGFEPRQISADHLGLKILEERTQAIGAALDLETHLGQGTQITVVWPAPKTTRAVPTPPQYSLQSERRREL